MLFTRETSPEAFKRDGDQHLNERQKRILALKVNDEFFFSYTMSRNWNETRYRVLHNGVVEMLSEHRHRESTPTPYPAGLKIVDADRKDRFTTLEDIAKRAVKSFMSFKEL